MIGKFNRHGRGASCNYGFKMSFSVSGIEVTHPDFEGRASWGIDLVQSPSARAYTDENGHGTHVTGKWGTTTLLL